MRLFTRLFILVTAAGVTANGFQTPAPSAAQRRDAYAVYSSILSSSDELLLIEATTLTVRYGAPISIDCVVPPVEDQARFKEVMADFNLRKDIPSVLEREFTLNRPYQLLSSNDAKVFLYDAVLAAPQVLPAGGKAPTNPNPLFPRARRVFRLADVFFDQSRSLALTYLAEMTTTMVGSGAWKVLSKTESGQWQEARTWQTCGWASGH
jgi:hypothetical protein